MEKIRALDSFAALGQATRLDAFRLLVQSGHHGMTAGTLSTTLGIRPNSLSANLAVLLRAGLVRNTREGRSIRYHADMAAMRDLIGFLLEDCCGGDPAQCRPLLNGLASPPVIPVPQADPASQTDPAES